MNYLRHLLSTKGPLHLAERAYEILLRFSFGRRRFPFELFEEVFTRHGVRITFCVTASLLRRHRDVIEKLQLQGHEIGAHGHFHVRMDQLSSRRQKEMVSDSFQLFSDAGFDVSGFRCPYLGFNDDTIEALEASRFSWTSGKITIAPGNETNQGVKRLASVYHFIPENGSPNLPQFYTRVLEIPITGPDDEILYERKRVRDVNAMEKLWMSLLERSYRNGDLYHFFFHPERLLPIKDALQGLISRSKQLDPKIWMPTLGELASWWNARNCAAWKLMSDGQVSRVKVDVSTDSATVLIKSRETNSSNNPFIEGYSILEPSDLDHDSSTGNVSVRVYPAGTGGKTYSIGLSGDTHQTVEEFLVAEGFWVVRSDEPEKHSLFINRSDELKDSEKRAFLESIEATPQPLLRLWRWPNACRSAFVISSDVCAIDFRDFIDRTLHF